MDQNGEKEDGEADVPQDRYHFEEGLRLVHPYPHKFECYAKRRWIGQDLLSIYAKEFKAFSRDYYKNAIEHWKPKE